MINWAIRYLPIVQEIQTQQPAWVLDVGSGSEGLKMFWHGNVVGVSIHFKRLPLHHAVKADSLALPFAENSCPFVVSCDLLEHIPPAHRYQAVAELARVAQNHLVLVFPAGKAADQVYQSLANRYRYSSIPEWLGHHLDYGLPDIHCVENWLLDIGWKANTLWFESARFHKTLLLLELQLGGKFFSYSLMRLFGPQIIRRLPLPQKNPKLRVILKCSRLNPFLPQP